MAEREPLVLVTAAELRALIREEVTAALGGKPRSEPRIETYVSSGALEKHFGVSRGTVHNWVHAEGCPHEVRGKILRFKMTAVEAWFSGRSAKHGGRR